MRIIGYIFLFFLILIVIIGISLHVFLKNNLIERLKEQVSESTNSEYALAIEGLTINYLNCNVEARNVTLTPFKKNLKPIKSEYTIAVGKINLINYSILPYLKDRSILLDSILLEGVQILIYQGFKHPDKKRDDGTKKSSTVMPLTKKLSTIAIGHIGSENVKLFVYKNRTASVPIFYSNNCNFTLEDLNLNFKTSKWFDSNKLELILNNFYYNVGDDGLYTFFGKKVTANYNDSTLIVDSLQLIPNYNKKEFAKKAGRQASRAEIITSQINFSKVNYKLFCDSNKLQLHKVNIKGCAIDIYRDNTFALAPILRPSFQCIVKNLPFRLSIDSMEMKNAQILFEVQNLGEATTGTIAITKMNTVITQLQSDTVLCSDTHNIKVVVNGFIANKGKFNLNYSFPLKATKESFLCSGNLSSMPITSFNTIIEQAKDISVKSGILDYASFSMMANENSSKGTMQFKYHDLKIDFLNKRDKKRGLVVLFKSFIANSFIVEGSNPGKSGLVRTTRIYSKRNPYRYFLFYTAQSILSGVAPAIVGEKNVKYFDKKK